MGRANYVILALGIATVFVLSLLMKHLLQVTGEHRPTPVAEGILANFGARLDSKGKVRIEDTTRGPRAVVWIDPAMNVPHQALALEVGEYIWDRLGEQRGLTAVVVMCQTWSQGPSIRIEVARPVARPAIGRPASDRPAKAAPKSKTAAPPTPPGAPVSSPPSRGGGASPEGPVDEPQR